MLTRIILFTWICSPLQGRASPVSFQTLAKELLNSSEHLKVGQLEIERQISSRSASKWALGPELSLTSDRTFTRTGNDGISAENATNLRAQLNLFDGFADWKNLEIAEMSVSRAQSEQEQQHRQELGNLAQAYLAWQKSYQKLNIVTQLIQVRNIMLQKIQSTVQTGERSQTDQLMFENLVLQAEERSSRTKMDQMQALTRIQKQLGQSAGAALAQKNPQNDFIFSKDFCDQKSSFANHPNIRLLSDQSNLSKAQRSAVSSEFYPSIDLSLEKQIEELSTSQSQGPETLRLSLTWPLYTGFSTRYKRLDMSYEVQKLELKKAEAFTELYYTNQENCAQLKSIDDWYLKANKIVANYKEVLTISRRQYQNGGISTLNLTDQELRLLDAELSLIDAIFARQEVLANQWLLHDGTLAFFNK